MIAMHLPRQTTPCDNTNTHNPQHNPAGGLIGMRAPFSATAGRQQILPGFPRAGFPHFFRAPAFAGLSTVFFSE